MSARARVRFDERTWASDMARATPEAHAAGEAARARLERDGVPHVELRPCEAEGRDGTSLPDCLKVYVPAPAGPWGLVFRLARDSAGVFLAVIAFGLRHPPPGRRSSVYQVAHQRLQQPSAEGG